MGLLYFLAWTLLIYLGIRVIWTLFGPRILQWGLRRLNKRMFEQWQQQEQARSDNQWNAEFEREIILSEDVRLRVPHQRRRSHRERRHAEAEAVSYSEAAGTNEQRDESRASGQSKRAAQEHVSAHA